MSKEFLERCCKCGDPIRGDMMRPKETGRPFHPECFRCDDCRRPIDKRYYSVDGRTVCHDDYVVSERREIAVVPVENVMCKTVRVKMFK